MSLHRTAAPMVMESIAGAWPGGTGPYTTGGSVNGGLRFQDVFSVGARPTYMVRPQNPADTRWERNRGGLFSGVTTLERNVVASSTGAAINWGDSDSLYIYIDSVADLVSSLRENDFAASRPVDLPRGGTWLKDLGSSRWQMTLWDGTDEIALWTADAAANRIEQTPWSVVAAGALGLSRADADGRIYSEATAPSAARYPGFDAFLWSNGHAAAAITINAWLARGTKAAPAAIAAGDTIQAINGYGHDGTTHQLAAQRRIVAEANFTGSGRDTALVESVAKGTALNEALRIDSERRVRIAGAAASGQLASLSDQSARAALTGDANHASYTGDVAELRARRASSSAFDFLACTADVAALGGAGGDPKLRILGDGSVAADGTYSSAGADYAEWFELAPEHVGPDWTGVPMVALDDGTVRPATHEDDPDAIVGVVSATPSIVGNAAELAWRGRVLRDEWGRPLVETVESAEWTERIETAPSRIAEDGAVRPAILEDRLVSVVLGEEPPGTVVPDDAVRALIAREVRNPAWDPARPYIPRSARAEWVCVGLLGRLRVRAGAPLGRRWKRIGAPVPGRIDLVLVR